MGYSPSPNFSCLGNSSRTKRLSMGCLRMKFKCPDNSSRTRTKRLSTSYSHCQTSDAQPICPGRGAAAQGCPPYQIARPFFTKDCVSDFDTFHQTSAKALNLTGNCAVAYAPIDVRNLRQRFTLESAALFPWEFGTTRSTHSNCSLRSLSVSSSARKDLHPLMAVASGASLQAFLTIAVLNTRRGVQGDTWPLLELFKVKTEEPIQAIMTGSSPSQSGLWASRQSV